MTARTPYVGEGADGCRRSAEIDRNEADCLDPGERRDAALASAARWDEQASEAERSASALGYRVCPCGRYSQDTHGLCGCGRRLD